MVSTQQYVCPDYLSPMPSSAESGKSPLELLAKTCSNIGLPDPPPAKQLKPSLPLESRSSGTDSSQTNAASGKLSKSSGEKSHKSSARDFGSSPEASRSPPHDKHLKHSLKSEKSSSSKHHKDSTSSTTGNKDSQISAAADSTSGRKSGGGKSNSNSPSSTTTTAAAKSPSTVQPIPASLPPQPGATPKQSCNGCLPPTNYPMLSPHLLSGTVPGNVSSSMLYGLPGAAGYPHGLSFSPGSYPISALQAAAMASAGLPSFLPPMCRDPNCRSCPNPVTMTTNPSAGGRPCPLGCTQCVAGAAHQSAELWWAAAAAAANYPFYSAASMGLPSFPGAPSLPNVSFGGLPPSSLSAALYYQTAAAAAAAAVATSSTTNSNSTTTPASSGHCCSWTIGSGLCNKRFDTPAELLEHLKSHASQETSTSSASNSANVSSAQQKLPATSPMFGQGSPAVSFPSATTGRLSPRSTYMNSLLSLNRYHPYAKGLPSPGAGIPGAAGLSHLAFPGLSPALGATYPFASLYSQRLPGSH